MKITLELRGQNRLSSKASSVEVVLYQLAPKSSGPNLLAIRLRKEHLEITRHTSIDSPLPLDSSRRLRRQEIVLGNHEKYNKTFEYVFGEQKGILQLRNDNEGLSICMTNTKVVLFPLLTLSKLGGMIIHDVPQRFLDMGFPSIVLL